MHAYGRATDTPGHLRALVTGDGAEVERAMGHLWSAVIHQGTPWTVTGPAAIVVAALVVEEETRTERAALLSFLAEVVQAAFADAEGSPLSDAELQVMAEPDDPLVLARLERAADLYDDDPELGPWGGDVDLSAPLYARAVIGCRAAVPAIAEAALRCRADRDPTVRSEAARIEVLVTRLSDTDAGGDEVLELLVARARDRHRSRDERCGAVLSIVELGADPSEFLRDRSLPVRACAALSQRAEEPRAFHVLLEALRRPAEIDGWFRTRPGHLRTRLRFALVKAAISRAGSFADLVDAAVEIAAVTSHYCVDDEWGPLLEAAFPDGRPAGTALDPHQRRYLEALVANPDVWQPIGNARRWLEPLGLDHDREAVRRLLRDS
jgi:hypothetical protein